MLLAEIVAATTTMAEWWTGYSGQISSATTTIFSLSYGSSKKMFYWIILADNSLWSNSLLTTAVLVRFLSLNQMCYWFRMALWLWYHRLQCCLHTFSEPGRCIKMPISHVGELRDELRPYIPCLTKGLSVDIPLCGYHDGAADELTL